MTDTFGAQDPDLLRHLLRAKDRMGAASHEQWPVRRLAAVSAVSQAHLASSFKLAFGVRHKQAASIVLCLPRSGYPSIGSNIPPSAARHKRAAPIVM